MLNSGGTSENKAAVRAEPQGHLPTSREMQHPGIEKCAPTTKRPGRGIRETEVFQLRFPISRM